MSGSRSIGPSDYADFISDLKDRIRIAHITAARAVNRELILLYWDIGHAIVDKQQTAGWGNAVVERLSDDLRAEFPEMRGFSADNLWRMRQFHAEYSSPQFLEQAVPELNRLGTGFLEQAVPEIAPSSESGIVSTEIQPFEQAAQSPDFWKQLVARVPWGHHIELLKKVKEPSARVYYLCATARYGWSRRVLLNQVKAGAYERATQEKKTHNFDLALPEHFAEQAEEMMKSRYNLEFLGIDQALRERDLENRLIDHLQRFLLELGYGFCFIGQQHRLTLNRKDYYVDLLFYHRFLKALVAFDVKLGEFEPEHAGKMDFYLNLLNDRERGPDEQPSIGIILCAEKDDIEVEYALKTKANPIGVAEYQLQTRLPEELKGKLPTARQLSDALRHALPQGKDAD